MWEARAIWLLRIAIVASAAVFVVQGELILAACCGLSLAVAIVPTYIVSAARLSTWIDLELVGLWLLATHVVLGIALDLYSRVPWFDKILHLEASGVVGLVVFVSVDRVIDQRVKGRWLLDGVLIVIGTIGVGAMWEIAEFTADHAFGWWTQGSPQLDPLPDTMWDLVCDGVGAALAALAGPSVVELRRRRRATAPTNTRA
ncbi:MAG: hypothetical protein ABI678_13240 [Kofleriaceae bacterium]